MVLYINACVRDESRTDKLASELLVKIGEYKEVNLEKEFLQGKLQPLTKDSLKRRDSLIEAGNYGDPIFDYAKQFASADTIVIAAPFWDFGIPALLRIYLEVIYAIGIVSKYNEQGMPVGLCKADKLYFVTTSGGPYIPDFSYNYVAGLAIQAFGISKIELIKAELLDIVGNNPDEIIDNEIAKLKNLF